MTRYYHTIDKNEALAPGPDIVILPPENAFWSPLPAGHQLTYDGNAIPTGTEPIPPPPLGTIGAAKIDLRAAGVTTAAVSRALYKDGRGLPAELNAIDAAIDAIVLAHTLSLEDVVDAI